MYVPRSALLKRSASEKILLWMPKTETVSILMFVLNAPTDF